MKTEKPKIDLSLLKKHIPYKWRIQSFSKNYPSATCVPYIDARDVMDMLDSVVGPENWECRYEQIKGNVYCYLGIYINGRLIEKSDCGTESKTEAEKGESSDAFKRAAVKWGIGRFLYDLGIHYVKTSEKKDNNNFPYPVNERGEKIKDLTNYINSNGATLDGEPEITGQTEKKQPVAPVPEKFSEKKAIYQANTAKNLDALKALGKKWPDQLNKEHPDLNKEFYKVFARKYKEFNPPKPEEKVENEKPKFNDALIQDVMDQIKTCKDKDILANIETEFHDVIHGTATLFKKYDDRFKVLNIISEPAGK